MGRRIEGIDVGRNLLYLILRPLDVAVRVGRLRQLLAFPLGRTARRATGHQPASDPAHPRIVREARVAHPAKVRVARATRQHVAERIDAKLF